MTQTVNISGRAVAGAVLGLIILTIIAGNLLISPSTGAPAGEPRSGEADSPGLNDQRRAPGPGLRSPAGARGPRPGGTPRRHRARSPKPGKRLAEKKRQAARFSDLPGGVSLATLNAIASCESGGDPRAVSSSGLYLGKYQFHTGTWAAVGGQGNPSEASEVEQDYRAALLYAQSGPGQWPVCGQRSRITPICFWGPSRYRSTPRGSARPTWVPGRLRGFWPASMP